MSLSNKTAIVTGGSKGIGASIASELAAQGANVVITYGSDAASAEALVSKLGKDKVLALKSDAGSTADIESLVKQTVDRFGGIDILIPNAGILPMKTLEETSEADFEACMTTNVKGPYFLCQVSLTFTFCLPSEVIVLLGLSLSPHQPFSSHHCSMISFVSSLSHPTFPPLHPSHLPSLPPISLSSNIPYNTPTQEKSPSN